MAKIESSPRKFTKICKLGEPKQNATKEPSESDLTEILAALNNYNFSTRTELHDGNPLYKYPDFTDSQFAQCHETARKYAEENENLKVVSGYIVEFETDTNRAILTSHSVVRDIENNTLWELMGSLYSIDKKFIEHSPEIKGHNLVATP